MTSEKVCVAREKKHVVALVFTQAGFLASAKTEEEDIYFCKATYLLHIKNDESPHLKLTD